MKITEYIRSQSIRFVKLFPPEDRSVYIGDLVKGIADRYAFLQVPTTIDDYNLSHGVTFIHGHYFKEFVIDKLQVFTNGLICESRTSTDNLDFFIADLRGWAASELGFVISSSEKVTTAYISELEVHTNFDLGHYFTQFLALGENINSLVSGYGQESKPFQIFKIGLHYDTANATGVKSSDFSFERRLNKPYSAGLYFSSAPLNTSDHLAILEDLERLLKSGIENSTR